LKIDLSAANPKALRMSTSPTNRNVRSGRLNNAKNKGQIKPFVKKIDLNKKSGNLPGSNYQTHINKKGVLPH
jgi:hypothetical protein